MWKSGSTRTDIPVIAISLGDPNGVGPELLVKALSDRALMNKYRFLIIGDKESLKRMAIRFRASFVKVLEKAPLWRNENEINFKNDIRLAFFCPQENFLPEPNPGKMDLKWGKPILNWIEKGAMLAKQGKVNALVTLAVNKKVLIAGGSSFPGHTELLAQIDHCKDTVMMLVSGKLRVALATHHIPLVEVPSAIEKGRLLTILDIMNLSLRRDFGIKSPKIGVAGLNPHAGETGILGGEELKTISPAIKEAQKTGIDAKGPFPADSIFWRALKGEFDAVLAMYHDQGLAPLKTIGFEKAVNVSLGLSFIRTSVGHGTAYELAGKGIAKEESLVEAIKLAGKLWQNRRRWDAKDG